MEKKKKHVVLKSAIVAGLGGSLLIQQAKNILFGRPPSKIRKAIFFTSMTAMIAYQCHQDKIDYVLNGTKEYVHQIIVDKNENENLKDKILYYDLRDEIRKRQIREVIPDYFERNAEDDVFECGRKYDVGIEYDPQQGTIDYELYEYRRKHILENEVFK